jgi:hypothetical protein
MNSTERTKMIIATLDDLRNDETTYLTMDIETARRVLGLPRSDRYDVIGEDITR